MTQYAVRAESEKSMWLKYKGNVMLEWTRDGGGFDWVSSSDIATHQADADSTYPFREYDSNTLQLYISEAKCNYGFKKADLDMEFHDDSGTNVDGVDDGEGVKLQSGAAYDVNNTLNIHGFLESDTWRDEQPFGGVGSGKGPLSKSYSLPQKELLLHNMAKRSGVQDYAEGSHFTSPVQVNLNWGYSYDNFNNFLRYLMVTGSQSYLTARTNLIKKWIPGYLENWNWSTNLTKPTLFQRGTIAEKTELRYSNTVIDDCRIKENAKHPNRKEIELRITFDTNNLRWTGNYFLFTGNNFDTAYAAIAPKSMSETAPSSYIGPHKTDW